jgi:hypothetical protein
VSRHTRLAVALYIVVGVVYTWPLVLSPLSAFPGPEGNHDAHAFLWNNWWIAQALWVRHVSPFYTPIIFAPFGADLRLHTFGLLYGALSSPFVPVLGTTGVLSLQLLATPVLNGFAMFALVAKLSGRRAPALVAGLLLAATPAVNFHLTAGRPSCAAVWPLVWSISALLDAVASPSARSAAWFGAALLALLLVDQQVAMFGLLWLALLGIDSLQSGRMKWPAARTIGIATAALAAPFIWLYARPLTSPGFTTPAASEAFTYSYPLALFWRPGLIWRAFGSLLPLAFVAAAGRIRGDRRLLVWWAGSALFLILMLGPSAYIFAALQHLPGLAQFRTPYRFQIPAAIGFSVLAGLLLSQASNRMLTVVAVAVFVDLLAYRVAHPVLLQSMPHEPVYEAIAVDPTDRLVLEVPVGVRAGTDQIGPGEIFTFYQPVHRKRLINGMLARGPLHALDYYRRSPALMFLAHEQAPPGDLASDLRRLVRDLEVGFIVIHADRMERPWHEQVVALVNTLDGLEPIHTGRTETMAFRLP